MSNTPFSIDEQVREFVKLADSRPLDPTPNLTDEEFTESYTGAAEGTDFVASTRPTGVGVFKAGFKSASVNMKADLEYLNALGNTLIGDKEAALDNIQRAQLRETLAEVPLDGLQNFGEFIEEPTVGGFFTQMGKAAGQVVPFAITTIAGAGVGGIGAKLLSKGGTEVSKRTAKRLLKESIEKTAKGTADPDEKALAESSYKIFRRMYKDGTFAKEAARRQTRNIKIGAAVGAGGAEWAPMAGGNFAEALESGQDMDRGTALRAAAVALPQAAVGVGGEALLLKQMGKLATRKAAGKPEGNLYKRLANDILGSGLKSGVTEGTTEFIQEGIGVANRMEMDDTYTMQDAKMRMAEAAFVGALGGKALGMAGGTARVAADTANRVFDKTKTYLDEARDLDVDVTVNRQQQGFGDGQSLPESRTTLRAQFKTLLDRNSNKETMWVEGSGTNVQEINALIKNKENKNATEIEPVEIRPGIWAAKIPERGTVISRNKETVQSVIETNANEEVLASALGYSNTKPTDADTVIQALDEDGNEIWAETTNAAGIGKQVLDEHGQKKWTGPAGQAANRQAVTDKDGKFIGASSIEVLSSAEAAEQRKALVDAEDVASRQAQEVQDAVTEPEQLELLDTPTETVPAEPDTATTQPDTTDPVQQLLLKFTEPETKPETTTESDFVYVGQAVIPVAKQEPEFLFVGRALENPLLKALSTARFKTREEATKALERIKDTEVFKNNSGLQKAMASLRIRELDPKTGDLAKTSRKMSETDNPFETVDPRTEVGTVTDDDVDIGTDSQRVGSQLKQLDQQEVFNLDEFEPEIFDLNEIGVKVYPVRKSKKSFVNEKHGDTTGSLRRAFRKLIAPFEEYDSDGNLKPIDFRKEPYNQLTDVVMRRATMLQKIDSTLEVFIEPEKDESGAVVGYTVKARSTPDTEVVTYAPTRKTGKGKIRTGTGNKVTGPLSVFLMDSVILASAKDGKYIKKYNGEEGPTVEIVLPTGKAEFVNLATLTNSGQNLNFSFEGDAPRISARNGLVSILNRLIENDYDIKINGKSVREKELTDGDLQAYKSITAAVVGKTPIPLNDLLFNPQERDSNQRIAFGNNGKEMGYVTKSGYVRDFETNQTIGIILFNPKRLKAETIASLEPAAINEMLAAVPIKEGRKDAKGNPVYETRLTGPFLKEMDVYSVEKVLTKKGKEVFVPGRQIIGTARPSIFSREQDAEGNFKSVIPKDTFVDATREEVYLVYQGERLVRAFMPQTHFDKRYADRNGDNFYDPDVEDGANNRVYTSSLSSPAVLITTGAPVSIGGRAEAQRWINRQTEAKPPLKAEYFLPFNIVEEIEYLKVDNSIDANPYFDQEVSIQIADEVSGNTFLEYFDPNSKFQKKRNTRRGGKGSVAHYDAGPLLDKTKPNQNKDIKNIINLGLKKLKLVKPVSILGLKQLQDLKHLKPKRFDEMFPGQLGKHITDQMFNLARNKQRRGTYMGYKDAHVIIVDNVVTNNPLGIALAVGHELGHAVLNEAKDTLIEGNKALYNRLKKSHKKAIEQPNAPTAWLGENGFDEWFSDQTATWMKQLAIADVKTRKTPKNGTESFFKNLATRLKNYFKGLETALKRRFTGFPSDGYQTFIEEVVENGGLEAELLDDTGMLMSMARDKEGPPAAVSAISNLRRVRDLETPFEVKAMVAEIRQGAGIATDRALAFKRAVGKFLNTPQVRAIARLVRTEDGVLRGISSKIANMFYVPAQSDSPDLGFVKAKNLQKNRFITKLGNILGTNPGEWDNPINATALKIAASGVKTKDITLATFQNNPDIDPESVNRAKKIREFLEEVHDDYISNTPGNTIKKRPDYFPVVLDIVGLANDPDMQQNFIKDLVAADPTLTEADVTKAIDYFVKRQRFVLESKQEQDVETIIGQVEKDLEQETKPKIKTDVTNPLADMEKARKLTAKVNPDVLQNYTVSPQEALIKYIRQTTTRNEFLRATRDPKTGKDLLTPELDKLNSEDRAMALAIIKRHLGYRDRDFSSLERKWLTASSYLQVFNWITLLPLVTIASMTELGGAAINFKDPSFNTFKTFINELKRTGLNYAEARELAEDLGVSVRNTMENVIVTDADHEFLDPKVRQISDKFFWGVGLERFTDFTRAFAANMGVQFLRTHAANKTNNPRAARYLKDLGVSASDINTAWNSKTQQFDFNSEEGRRVQAALTRFVESSMLRPNTAERPFWANDPRFALIWQLKGFLYSFGKVILGGITRESATRFKESGGDWKQAYGGMGLTIALAGIAYLPLAMLSLELRELTKAGLAGLLPGLEMSDKYFRSDKMDWGPYMVEIFDRAGFNGPLSIANNMLNAEQWGKSPAAPLLGPTYEALETTFSKGWKVIPDRLIPLYSVAY